MFFSIGRRGFTEDDMWHKRTAAKTSLLGPKFRMVLCSVEKVLHIEGSLVRSLVTRNPYRVYHAPDTNFVTA